jgi:hypothetical protein
MLTYNAVPIPAIPMSTDPYSVNGFVTPVSTTLTIPNAWTKHLTSIALKRQVKPIKMGPRNGRKPTHEPHREAKETGGDTEYGRQQMVKDASAVCWSFAGVPHSVSTQPDGGR